MPRPFHALALLLLLSTLPGCKGGGGAEGAGNGAPTSGDYLPYAVGDRWVYDIINTTGTAESSLMMHVHSTTEIGGETALFVHEVLPGAGGYNPFKMRHTPTMLSRLFTEGEHGSVTALLQFTLPLVANTAYTAYSHTGTPVEMDNDGIDDAQDLERTISIADVESVSVPLGTFRALKISTHDLRRFHYSSDGSEVSEVVDSTIWYAPGVGPIKEISTVAFTGRDGRVFGGTDTKVLRHLRVGAYRSDRTAPRVIAVEPAANATFSTWAPPDTLLATFNEAMDPRSFTTATVTLTGIPQGAVPGYLLPIAAADNRIGFRPDVPLAAGTYTVRLDGVTDLLGNALPPYSWSFTVD
jgi:hypothetical protein